MTSTRQALQDQFSLLTPASAIPERKQARRPVLVALWALLAPVVPGLWARIRTRVLATAGFGFLCWAAWMLAPAAGAAAVGVALLLLELLGRGGDE